MKKYLFSIIFLLVSYVGFSQKGLSYQAVILDPTAIEVPGQDITGQPLVNGDVWMKFSIYNGSTLQFEEVQKTKTDAYGLVNLMIGSVSTASFNSLTWDGVQKSMQVFVSFNQGASYTKVSDQKLNYNPYALYAETAGKLGSVLSIAGGGTGATTAADARVNLGLGNVDNTSDAAKPISTATNAALALKANTSDVNAALALKANTSDVNAALALKANTSDMTAALAAKADTGTIKTFVVTQVAAATIADADASTKGKIQLAGDLAGTADAPTVPGLALKANISSLSAVATSGDYNDLTNKPTLPKASATELGGIKVGANLSIDANGVLSAAGGSNASSISGVVPIANGGTGSNNVAGIKSTLGLSGYNVAIGSEAGLTNQAANAISVGSGAGRTTQGTQSVAVGYVAGSANQGAYAVSVGTVAGQASQGANAVAVGFAAGQNGQGANSVAVGSYAGQSQVANSIAINATGSALNPTTAGFYVAPIRNASSSSSLFYNTATKEITYGTASSSGVPYTGATGQVDLGAYNLSVNGLTVGKGINSVGSNVSVGISSLAGTGNYNNAFGSNVLASNTTGTYNNAFGYYTLNMNTTGTENTAVGTTALYRNTTGSYNSAFGNQAMGNSLTGSNNTAIGYQPMYLNTTGSNNTATGYQALKANTIGSYNTAIGKFALNANVDGNYNTAIGNSADVASATLTNATAIGNGAIVSASNTIQLGNTDVTNVKTSGTFTAGTVTYPKVHGTANQVLSTTGSGTLAWTTITSGGGDASSLTGTLAIANGGTGSSTKNFVDLSTTQLIGGIKAFSSDLNIFGITAGRGNSGVSYNTVFGLAALNANTTGDYNNAFGSQALAANLDGYYNSAFGQTALFRNTSGADNSGFGINALNANTSGSSNTAMGSNSLVNSTTGSGNSALGMSALSSNTTGSNNTGLGYQTNVSANNLTNATAIGYGAIVSASNTIQLGNANVTDVKTSATITAASINSPIYASTPQALTDGSTVVWNPVLGLNASVTLGGNRNLAFLYTPTVGSYGTLVVTQDGTGNRTLNLPSVANKVLGSSSTTTIALSTAAGAKDIVNFYYDGTNYFWNVGQGYGIASSSSSTANLATGVTGTLSVANGGTGATTLTGIVKGSGTSALSAAVAGTDYLAPNGSAASLTNFPTFNQNTTGTAANVTGVVSVANGGTGSTNGSITGTSSITIAAGGSNQNISILPSGTGSIGIGTSAPNSLAILDASSTTKGFLPPRMTYAQKTAISSPPQGLMIYCTNCGTNGEPEYFNGSSWVNMAGGAAASVPISLGSTYGGGIVFYILQSGDPGYVAGETHGLIAATSDTQGYRVFGCRGWPSGVSTALGTGSANTTTLLGCSETNFAAKLARAVRDGGYTDWFLPSKDELNKLYLNRNSVGNFIDVNYWSSSECLGWVGGTYFGDRNNEAFYQNFSNGTQSWDDKNAQKGIRAIRSF